MSDQPDYASLRARNIQRNCEYLASLGLLNPIEPTPAKTAAVKRTASSVVDPSAPLRRSRRLTGAAASNVAIMDDDDDDEEEGESSAELLFADSRVRRYAVARAGGTTSSDNAYDDSWRLSSFQSSERDTFRMKRAYCVDVGLFESRLLLAMAGHEGHASVCALRASENGDAELCSWRAGRGWISSCQFLHDGKFLTSSNDGDVRIWDLALATAAGVPKQLFCNESLHRGGIFRAHFSSGVLLTASKDKTVAVSAVDSERGVSLSRRFCALHSGVVKSVCVRPDQPSVFASAGNDRRIVVADTRSASDAPSLAIAAHATAINAVQVCGELVLSASFSPTLLVHDVRQTGAPLFEVAVNSTPRTSQILRPSFCDGGRCVVAGSATSNAVMLFDARDGATISRGELPFKCFAVDCGALDAACVPAVNAALAQQFPSAGGRALIAVASGDSTVQVLSGNVAQQC
jgi:hypothetical protein